MWASLKNDLKEFATGAAEETAAVADKVGIDISTSAAELEPSAGTTSSSTNRSSQSRVNDGSVMLANAALSMGQQGLRGLSSAASIIGGVVAPRVDEGTHDLDDRSSTPSDSFASSAAATIPTPIKSALAVDDGEDEEELGWGSDDDDIEVEELVEAGDSQGDRTVESKALPAENTAMGDLDKEVMRALQSKLDAVEKEREELQGQLRRQTGELVEIRAKLEEFSSDAEARETSVNADDAVEIEALRAEVKQLQQQLSEQMIHASKEKENAIAEADKDKEWLGEQIAAHKSENEELKLQNQTLQEAQQRRSGTSSQQDEQLQEYQQQIKDLTAELESLQANQSTGQKELMETKEQMALASTNHVEELSKQVEVTKQLEQALADIENTYQAALKEAESSKVKIRNLESEVQSLKADRSQEAELKMKLEQESQDKTVANDEGVVSRIPAPLVEVQSEETNKDDSKEDSGVKVEEIVDDLSDDWGDGEW
ncbi:hypothetical protein THAOC_16459 [Thalassiosira oceanica]|uniref:Uncharacterized protein n=1 Tax=Thalassiosira oceanica TaxID=159749 RepID=K0SXD7_THAOC|nr:hypothetical protein THAOC_16459 [Thalassiosira oceanica]|eukprot:EJK62912.1 hypothetical protein THAOC_16459 [Thalassiosira oceanica]